MSTRGFFGFVIDGTEKIAYNHSDSYPSGLGMDVLRWLQSATSDMEHLRKQVAALRVASPGSQPTSDDIARLAPHANRNVGSRSLDDWYVLLRETQGDPQATLDAGVIEDASNFPADSLFAEWGYVVDLDAGVFEVYEGFQRSAHSDGRFASRDGSDGYAPVRLIASWSFAELPADRDAFLAAMPDDA